MYSNLQVLPVNYVDIYLVQLFTLCDTHFSCCGTIFTIVWFEYKIHIVLLRFEHFYVNKSRFSSFTGCWV